MDTVKVLPTMAEQAFRTLTITGVMKTSVRNKIFKNGKKKFTRYIFADGSCIDMDFQKNEMTLSDIVYNDDGSFSLRGILEF